MKRYSVAPSSSRRKSTISSINNETTSASREELEKLEQETTLVLQEIDKNISRANAVINDRLIPIIKDYSNESKKVWNNAGFWKYFFEQSANVELNSYEDPISNTDVNTLANSRSNMLFNEDEDDEEEEDDADANDEQNREGEANGDKIISESEKPNADVFRKPTLKPHIEESTPTWSTEQTKKSQMQSSTPQMNKKPSLLPGYNRQGLAYESNDSIGIQPPPVLTASLSSSEGTGSKSPKKSQQDSPVKVHMVRQSLDTYHKLSISPRKASRTPNRQEIVDDVRRRSSLIQNLINSSPTLPEPPILRSELAEYSQSSSPNKYGREDRQLSNVERLSPVLLPPELSPTKSLQLTKQQSREPTIQRFPTTPIFSERLSDGGKLDIMKTPLGVRLRYGEEDSDLQPPELHNSQLLHNSEGFSKRRGSQNNSPDVSDKRRKPSSIQNNDDNENVFLDTSKNIPNNSAGSTIYHSLSRPDHGATPGADATENQSQSRSISQIFDDILNSHMSENNNQKNSPNDGTANLSQILNRQKSLAAKAAQNSGAGSAEVKDLFSDVPESRENSQLDNTENSTSELGSMLRERFNNITNYRQKPT